MSNDYFSKPGLSFHQLKDLATISPAYYMRKHVAKTIQDEDKDSYRLGRLVHLAILEPLQFAEVPQVPSEFLTPSGNLSTRSAAISWVDSQNTRDFATPGEVAMCQQMASAVYGNTLAADLLKAPKAQVEKEIFTTYKGIAVKGKADLISRGRVWDVKTTRNLNGIVAEIRDFHYAEQIAWYSDILKLLPGGIIAVEKQEPYRSQVITFDAAVITAAMQRAWDWLDQYRDCSEAGDWPNDLPAITLTVSALANA